jgi:hypothetical protein
MSTDIANNRSALRDFLGSVATVSGDLSSVQAPPFVLSENSTVEIPQYWADHPALFVSQGAGENAEKRALSVLKYFIGTLRNQQYAGRSENSGVKKPLNAFLGELFLGHWSDEELGETRLVAEQVGHHPPVTACYLANDKAGVRAHGFTQQEITFNGNVNIKQKGYAMLHLDKYDEDYLIPVPNIKVKGILGGTPYPELQGNYSLISSNGYISRIKFEGKSFFGSGQKNGFEAKLFHKDQPDEILYTASGAWNGKLTIQDARSGTTIETFDVNELKSVKVQVADLSEQDPWESRNAWRDVISSLHNGDMRGVVNAKAKLEEGQRQMRAEEEAHGKHWKPVFFDRVEREPVFDKLSALDPGSFTVNMASGFWTPNREAVVNAKKPFHGDLMPNGARIGQNGHHVKQKQQNGTTRNGSMGQATAAPAEKSRHSVDGLAMRHKDNGTQKQRRAQSVSAPASHEPTDAQVEAFLRSRHSNLVR